MPPDDRFIWSLSKGSQSAEATFWRIDGVGLELRWMWNGELAHGRIYMDVQDLLRASNSKREELEARGWSSKS